MTVIIRKMGTKGDEKISLTLDEAQSMVDSEAERYFVVDEETTKIIQEIKLRDGQKVMLVPFVQGG